ncbi:MAG: DNA primase [Acidobacteriota bacterium]
MTTVHRVEDLKSLVDPLLVYQDYVRLTRRGRRSVGLCPFHKEKTPSFSVDGDNGLFYCFGCHRGGDVIKFLMEVEGCSFLEAAEILARKAGVRLETRALDPSRGTSDRRERLLKLLAAAARYYRQAFEEASPQSPVRAYARKRGIRPETAEKLRLGFAPPEGGLLPHLARQDFAPAEALEAGLLVERGRGEYAERFRNRLLFPIEDTLGRTVGFGGRALGDEEPKYLNSPESPVFQKRDLLYGLAVTRQAVREAGRILLVEGYMDFLAAFQAGVPYAAATLGTALAEGQVRLVKRYAREVVLNFDRDPAGLQAAERAILLLLGEGLRIRVALVPSGKDPDGFIAAEGPDAYRRVVERAVPFFDFLVERALSSGSLEEVEGRMAFVDRLSAFLSAVSDPLERQEYLREVAARTGMEPSLLRKRLQEPAGEAPPPPQGRHPDLPALPVREQLLVKGFFTYPEAARRVLADLPAEALDSVPSGPLLKGLLAGDVADAQHQALLARVLNGCHEVPSEEDLRRAAAEVQVEYLRRKERELARQIREASRRSDLDLVQILNREKMALLQEIGALME